MAVLDLCCCEGSSLVAESRGYSLTVVCFSHGGVSCCGAWTLGGSGFSSCGTWALQFQLPGSRAQAELLQGLWDLRGPGMEPTSPASVGGFSTTETPGKPQGYNPVCSRCGHIQLILGPHIFSDFRWPAAATGVLIWQMAGEKCWGKTLPGTTLNQNLELGVHMSQLPHLSGEMTLRSLSQLLPSGPCWD